MKYQINAAQMQLFEEAADRRSSEFGSASFVWQWHGRQIFMELRNDFRFPRKPHRVVYHLADACETPDEAVARAIFHAGYPSAQTTGFFCVGPVEQPKCCNPR
jgi:hypothetical protein